jgi:hypothetical protein
MSGDITKVMEPMSRRTIVVIRTVALITTGARKGTQTHTQAVLAQKQHPLTTTLHQVTEAIIRLAIIITRQATEVITVVIITEDNKNNPLGVRGFYYIFCRIVLSFHNFHVKIDPIKRTEPSLALAGWTVHLARSQLTTANLLLYIYFSRLAKKVNTSGLDFY